MSAKAVSSMTASPQAVSASSACTLSANPLAATMALAPSSKQRVCTIVWPPRLLNGCFFSLASDSVMGA